MSNVALVRATPASATGPLEFTPEQTQMIRDMYARGASDSEFAVLLETARVRRLNPLVRQIHFVKRWDKQLGREVWSAQVSIDGLRAIAERTGRYDGQEEPEYLEDKDGRLKVCKVRVYRKDWSPGRAAVGVARWEEYVQTTKEGRPTAFWSRMPYVMLAKCAEALAIRKAFPEDTSGLYVPEEMGHDPLPAIEAPPAADSSKRLMQPDEPPEDMGPSDEDWELAICEDYERKLLQAPSYKAFKAVMAEISGAKLTPHFLDHLRIVARKCKAQWEAAETAR